MVDEARVLIVEDDIDWDHILKEYIQDYYEVVTVNDFDLALKAINDQFYNVIILDLRLEDDDDENFQGMELLDYLRKNLAQQQRITKVIIISAYGTQEQIRKSFKSYDLFDYIPKQSFNKKKYKEIIDRAVLESELS